MKEQPFYVAKIVNNRLVGLNAPTRPGDKIEYVPLGSWTGLRVYENSLTLILIRAVKEIYPKARLVVEHSLSRGLYCELFNFRRLNETHIKKIEERMRKIISRNEPILQSCKEPEKLLRSVRLQEKTDRLKLFKYADHKKIEVYACGKIKDFFPVPLVPSTGFLKVFGLKYYPPGFILRFPRIEDPERLPHFQNQKKLFNIFQEHEKWAKILGVDNVGMLNEIIKKGEISKFIKVSEALHEKKVALIADDIVRNRKRIRLVFIAGPSGAGKTTFSKRLSIQLLVNEIPSFSISIDNYFLERDKTPKDASGNYDFESIKAIDVALLAEQIDKLLKGKAVFIPQFSFHTGRRKRGERLKVEPKTVLIIEGLHGLNEALLAEIPRAIKFKIYINALTQLNLDDHHRISTTDTRMVRRIVRDYLFRGYEGSETIKRWYQIRKGEEENIYPFQEDADAMFNSALIYELAVLKTYIEPILKKIKADQKEFYEARRLLNLLSYFLPVTPDEVPPTSILREFIGGSSFLY